MPSPSVHLELPALPAAWTSASVAASWQHLVELAGSKEVQGVWFSGDPVGSSRPSWDPIVLAAGAVRLAPRSVLGVVSAVAAGRHPAILAREVTALDVVSGGRAAVLLTGGESCEQLSEAAAVCRAVFSDANPAFEGRYFHVAGAVNRPGPVHPSGPPLLVEVPNSWPELVETGGAGHELGGRLVSVASAIVCRGGPAELMTCRRALDALWSRTTPGSAHHTGGPPGLWWRGPARADGWPGIAVALGECDVGGVVFELPGSGAGGSRCDDLARAVDDAVTWVEGTAC